MAMTERRIRQIIKEEAARALQARRLRESPFDFDEMDADGDEVMVGRGTGKGWVYAGSQGDEAGLRSGDVELDRMWSQWFSLTERILNISENGKFPLEDQPREMVSVSEMMDDVVKGLADL